MAVPPTRSLEGTRIPVPFCGYVYAPLSGSLVPVAPQNSKVHRKTVSVRYMSQCQCEH